jgi:cytochrome c oxidase subunit 4
VTSPDTSPAAPLAEAAHAGPHVLPVRVLLATAGFLFALTLLTVTISLVDLGRMNVVMALGIATVKAIAVAAFFMHLRYEGRFHVVVLVGCAVFAALMVAFIVFDTTQYQPDVRAHDAASRAGAPPPRR